MSKLPAPAAVPTEMDRDSRRPPRGLGRFFGPRSPLDDGDRPDWVSTLITAVMVVVVGVVVGGQIAAPDRRTLSLIMAIVAFALAWRSSMLAAVGFLLVALPWPRGTSFGSTNVVLVALIAIMWLLRVSLRRHAAPHGSAVDAPIAALLLSFAVSFYNVDRETMPAAVQAFGNLLACIVVFYLIVNVIRSPEDLERAHRYQALSIGVVGLMSLYELLDPTATVIPGWISFYHGPRSEAINIHNVRVGGPFTDFELLSEYFAINLLLLLPLTLRTKSPGLKFAMMGALGLCWLGMFETMTRGGIIALAAGILYLAWLQRRKLNAVNVGIGSAAIVFSFLLIDFVVARFTKGGDLLARLLEKQAAHFVNGMPEARSNLWRAAFFRMMEHPWIGHGPVYTIQREIGFWFWPHNGYLFVGNLVGVVGLSFFLWLLVRLFLLSRQPSPDLQDPNYARAFLVAGNVQIVVFMIDQTKIDFMRNPIYLFQVWLMFAWIVAAHRVARLTPAPERIPPPAPS